MKRLFALILMFTLVGALSACDWFNGEDEILDIVLTSDLEEAELTMDADDPLADQEVTVTASEVEGYVFEHWLDSESGDILSEERSYTFTPSADMTLEAVYSEAVDAVEATLHSEIEGVDLQIDPDGPVQPGTDVTLSASEVEGYVFDYWYDTTHDSVLSEDAEHTFTLEEDLTIEAIYIPHDEYQAREVYDSFTGDLSHLDTFADAVEASGESTMAFNLVFEEPLNGETERMEMDFSHKTVLDGDDVWTETWVFLETPEETIELTFYTETIDEETMLYVDVSAFLDMMEEEMAEDGEELDFRELFDLEAGVLSLPLDPDSEEADAFYEALDEIYGIEREDFEDALGELERFGKYLDPLYYDDKGVGVDVEWDGDTVYTTMTFTGDELQSIFEDMVADIYAVLSPLDAEDELPELSEIKDSDEYQFLYNVLGFLPDIDVTLAHNPSAGTLEMELDLANILEDINNELDPEGETLTVSMTMRDHAEVEMPEESRPLEAVANEFIRMMTLIETLEFTAGLSEAGLDEDTYSLAELDAEGHSHPSPFLDREASEIVIDITGETLTPDDIEAHLQYIEGGAVFHDGYITLAGLFEVFEDFDEENPPETRDDLLDILAVTDPDALNVWAVLLHSLEEEVDPEF